MARPAENTIANTIAIAIAIAVAILLLKLDINIYQASVHSNTVLLKMLSIFINIGTNHSIGWSLRCNRLD